MKAKRDRFVKVWSRKGSVVIRQHWFVFASKK